MTDLNKIAPLVLKPCRINNITHAIALLKCKQEKYKKYKTTFVSSNAHVYTEKKDKFNYEEVFQGFLEQKAVEKFNILNKNVLLNTDKFIQRKLQEKKEEIEMTCFNVRLSKNTEKYLFEVPTPKTFEDEFLFDIFTFLQQNHDPMTFLTLGFEKYMKKFLKVNTGKNTDLMDVTSLVKDFVKLAYNKTDFNIAIYEDRYLWAEVYVLLRLNKKDAILELIEQNNKYFDHMNDNIGSYLKKYLNKESCDIGILCGFKDDKFKMYLNNLMYSKVVSDGAVVASAEDYLFTMLACKKKATAECFENLKVKLLVHLFNKNYKKAAKLVLTSNFTLIAKFFILFQLCGISNYNHFADDSTTISMRSTHTATESQTVPASTAMFLNFFFAVMQKFENVYSRVKLLELIQNNEDYAALIPEYLIKYNLFDVVKSPCLEKSFFDKTVFLLKQHNSKKLLEISEILDVDTYGEVMEDVLEQAILTDEKLKVNFEKSNMGMQGNLSELYKFYKFNTEPNSNNLAALNIFEHSAKLPKYKFVIEHIFNKAVDIINENRDETKAKIMFRICGQLELSEECSKYITSELVDLI